MHSKTFYDVNDLWNCKWNRLQERTMSFDGLWTINVSYFGLAGWFKRHIEWFLNWAKVLKNGTSKICGRQPLKDWNKPYHSKFFKGYLPQIVHSLFLNT